MKTFKLVVLASLILFTTGCFQAKPLVAPVQKPITNENTNSTANVNSQPVGLANPASTNCMKLGGAVDIRTKPDGSQYGVCKFAGNRECEEWALLRGDCPVGGEAVTPPTADKTVDVTLADNQKTITVKKGSAFLLKLGEQYTWDISIDDQSVIARNKTISVIRGAQGVYDAIAIGTAHLTATGDPTCRQVTPPCAMPSILFSVTIKVE